MAGLVYTYQYIVYSVSLFTVLCIALFYCLSGRGQRAGDIAWLLEGESDLISRPPFTLLFDVQVLVRTRGVVWAWDWPSHYLSLELLLGS